MAETKLEKVNERLYHQPQKDGEPYKWAKKIHPIFLKLSDIHVELCLKIERPETSLLSRFGMEMETRDDEKAEQENMTTSGEEEREKYSEHFGWRIRATGLLDDGDKIGVIWKDGTVTGREEHFDSAKVFLKPVSDTDKEKLHGFLFYTDAEYEKRTDPYLCLELFVPETRLEKLCNEIVSSRLSAMQVGVEADLFQSE